MGIFVVFRLLARVGFTKCFCIYRVLLGPHGLILVVSAAKPQIKRDTPLQGEGGNKDSQKENIMINISAAGRVAKEARINGEIVNLRVAVQMQGKDGSMSSKTEFIDLVCYDTTTAKIAKKALIGQEVTFESNFLKSKPTVGDNGTAYANNRMVINKLTLGKKPSKVQNKK